jgi:hypothetical protein
MNTVRFFTTALVGIVTTCVMSAGAASAQPAPSVPSVPQVHSPSLVTTEQTAAAKAKARLEQKAEIAHMERVFAQRATAERRGSVAGNQGPASPAKPTAPPRVTPTTPSPQSGDGSEVPVLAVTALAGLALGAAGSSASRRLRNRPGLPP